MGIGSKSLDSVRFARWFALALAVATAAGYPPAWAQEQEPTGEDEEWGTLTVLGTAILPDTKQRLRLHPTRDFAGQNLSIPVWIARGTKPGPTLCVTAGIHGDELNGIEICRRIFTELDPSQLSGTLVVLPVINIYGFFAGDRYLHDRRDLNRAFPGNPRGSAASVIAHEVFEVVKRCDALVDLHTASDQRTNLPQIRTDLSDAKSLDLARSFGVGVVLDGEGPPGSLRKTAVDAGIPAIIYEAGAVFVLQTDEIGRGVEGVHNVMRSLGMLAPVPGRTPPRSIVYTDTTWVRVPPNAAGVFLTSRKPGDIVKAGGLLGEVVDPMTDQSFPIQAPQDGKIIGMVVPTIVYTGDGLFHLGLEEMPE